MPARFLHLRSDGDGIRLGDDALKLKNVGTIAVGYEKRTHGITVSPCFLWSQLRDLNSWPADYESDGVSFSELYQISRINFFNRLDFH